MVENNKVYINFEKEGYIVGKSDFLKIQIEIIGLKKIIRNYLLNRTKKIEYINLLDNSMKKLSSSMKKIDDLMILNEGFNNSIGEDIERATLKPKSPPKKKEKEFDINNIGDVEEELLRIREKLNSLGV